MTGLDNGGGAGGGAGVDAEARKGLLLAELRRQADHGISVQNMIDGFVDAFEDETGVDAAASQGQTYDATGDLYSNAANQVQIAQGTGTVLGDMTLAGGLAAAFDGVTSQLAVNCARKSGTPPSPGYAGKDWGAGNDKTITGFKAWGSSDTGFDQDGNGTITITLEGSTDNFSASIVDLGSAAGVVDSNGLLISKLSGLTETTAYRYHRLKFVTTTGTGDLQTAEIQFFEDDPASDMLLQSVAYTADAAPDNVLAVLWQEDIDAATENTDFKFWATREGAGRTVTTDFATDDKIDLTANDLVADNRVMFTTTTTLPAGLALNVLYFVKTATANDFEVSLTSGGATVDITDNGTGTHKVHKFDQVTMVEEVTISGAGQVLTGELNIGGQVTGTSMRAVVETLNVKSMNIHGIALEWR